MDKVPYVHNYIDELEVLPFLARGSNAVVFHTIGLLLPAYPDGADAATISKYTGLSDRTVRAALTLLKNSDLIGETSGGKFTPTKYIEYRSGARVVRNGPRDQSISSQSHISAQSHRQSVSTVVQEARETAEPGDAFGKAVRGLASLLMSYGGMNGTDIKAFNELWEDYPDPELHARALEITRDKAARPNYRYYESVVRTGAKVTVKPTADKPEVKVLEVLL